MFDYAYGVALVAIMFGLPLLGIVLVHNDQQQARRLGPYGGHLPLRRYDVLPQDDPPVAAPFPGEPTGS